MAKTKLFISSVQAEFAEERQMLFEYILSDPLMGRFFNPFLFERLPAIDELINKLDAALGKDKDAFYNFNKIVEKGLFD